MKKIVMKKVVQDAGKYLEKNSPLLLTGCAVVGVVTTTVLAIKATPEAMKIIEEEKQKKEEITKVEVVKLTWQCYIPVAIMGSVTIACMVGATSINLKRNAAIVALYSLSKDNLKEYQDKVKELLGEKKEEEVKDAIMKDRIEYNPYNTEQVVQTGKGNVLCYDSFSGRYFMNDIENIRRIINDLNWAMMSDMMRISLNDLYYALGLGAIKMGDDYGWDLDRPIDVKFSSQLQPETKKPCLVLDYDVDLIRDWI